MVQGYPYVNEDTELEIYKEQDEAGDTGYLT